MSGSSHSAQAKRSFVWPSAATRKTVHWVDYRARVCLWGDGLRVALFPPHGKWVLCCFFPRACRPALAHRSVSALPCFVFEKMSLCFYVCFHVPHDYYDCYLPLFIVLACTRIRLLVFVCLSHVHAVMYAGFLLRCFLHVLH